MQDYFPGLWELFHGVKFCYNVFKIPTSHWVWTHVLIVPCVGSHMSNLLRQSDKSVYMQIYFRWNNAFLMLFTCKIHKKFFILCLISSHPALWQFFLFYGSINSKPWMWRNIRNFFRADFLYISILMLKETVNPLNQNNSLFIIH